MLNPRSENLFRRNALDALTEFRLGQSICVFPPAWTWVTVLLAILFFSAVVASPFVEWHRTESVQGRIVPDSGIARITSPRAGFVLKKDVVSGQRVTAGQVLAVISVDRWRGDGKSRGENGIRSVEQSIAEIDVRVQLTNERLHNQLKLAESRRSLLRSEKSSIDRQLGYEQKRLAIAEDRLKNLQHAGAAVAAWDIQVQQEELAARRSAIEGLKQQEIRVADQFAKLKAVIESTPLTAQLELSELRARRTALQRELADDETEFAVIAPVSGVVADAVLFVGDKVAPNQSLITVIPDGARLHAELYVPSKLVAKVQPGQQVRLFVDAWPREKYGAIAGTVDGVAGFVSESSRGSYRVIVSIGETDRRLRPGMSLGAELLLERRDAVDWLAGPLRSRIIG